MKINGKCHCGNIGFELDWPHDATPIAARACGCSFCVKHGGVWTSNPSAKLAVLIRNEKLVHRYEFGTRTARFHLCAQCGVVPIVTCELGENTYAVVNVHTFENVDQSSLQLASASFDGEDVEARLARRQRNWIADVRWSVLSAR